MQDPRQKLLALFTTMFALGAGPHSGAAAGALRGLNLGQQALQHDQLQRWDWQRQQQEQQAKIVEQQQAELDRQRMLKLQTTFENFRKDLTKVTTDEQYQKLVNMYVGGLNLNGYRFTPEYFYQNPQLRFTPPTDQEQIQQKLKDYWANPLVQARFKADPNSVLKDAITYTPAGQKVAAQILIPDAMKILGQELNLGPGGRALFSTIGKGTEGQQALARAESEFNGKFGHPPDAAKPEDNNWITDRAHKLLLKDKPPLDPLDEERKRLEIEKLRRDLAQPNVDTSAFQVTADRPTKETGNVVDKTTGLSNNALYQNAMAFALEGKMPSLGLGSRAQIVNARNAIQNKAAALADAAGVTLPQLRQDYAANRAAMVKLLPQARATESAANAASDNLDLALDQSQKTPRTGARLVNRYVQWAQGELTPAAGLTTLETYLYTAAREYAKVTSGGALSAQGLTDSAAREATKLINAAQSPQALAAAVTAMKNDMANVISERQKTLAGISSTVASFLSGTPVTAPPPTGTTKPGQKIGRFEVSVK